MPQVTNTPDAANRLTAAGGVTYTWDDRGNLANDGTFTYTYASATLSTGDGAGRLVQAESVTSTLVYTYASTSLSAGTATGLRVAQSVDGDASAYAWDWASGLPEMLSEGGNLYLVGHETLGWWDGNQWAYILPDALGSVRQVTDETGAVTDAREWTPYGEELALSGAEGVGGAQEGLGYTGEWQDAALGLTYLRARWYDAQVGRFTQVDPVTSLLNRNGIYGAYAYVGQNPINGVDPNGYFSPDEIASAFGMSDFNEVASLFDAPSDLLSIFGGRWGLLKLLREAKNGDRLGLLNVGLFGWSNHIPLGTLHSSGCEIRLDGYLFPPTSGRGAYYWEDGAPLVWLLANYLAQGAWAELSLDRSLTQAYYLNGKYYRDASDAQRLPDYASAVFDVDIYVPEEWAGAGIGTKAAYTVDRYGKAYLTVPIVSLNAGVGLGPASIGYTESRVEEQRGYDVIAADELEDIITKWFELFRGGSVNLAILELGVEVDQGPASRIVTTMGPVIGQLALGVDVLETTIRIPDWLSVNPDGWIEVERYQRYSKIDILTRAANLR